MKTVLTYLMLIAAITTPARADAPSQEQHRAQVASAAVTVSAAEVRAMVPQSGHDVTLSVNGKGAVQVGLPQSENVTEIRIGRWMNAGIALAIETRNSETNEVSYFWSTAWVNSKESQISKPVVGRFLKSKIDYDVVGVVNSQSDSICITLLRHQRDNDSQSFDGQIYVNNCPVGPDVQGVLLPLAVNSRTADRDR